VTAIEERPGDDTEAIQEAGQPDTENTPTGYVQELVDATGYASAQGVYLNLGWPGVLPLPPRSKASPPTGFTGREGDWPSEEMLATWARMYPDDANLCLRLDEETIGIDVDAYGTKTGAQTLDEAEKLWGSLPPTASASSRDDGVSGIRLYRVPAGTVLRDRIKFADLGIGDIEILQRHHRYVVCWPSVHPETKQRYRWRDADGAVLGSPPSPRDLPELPDRWLTELRADSAQHASESPNTQPRKGAPMYEATDSMTGGQPSAKVAQRLGEALYDLDQGHSRHDTVRDHVMALLRYGNNGETGVDFALGTLYAKFVDAVGLDRPGGESEAEFEFERMITNAGHLLDDPAVLVPTGETRRAEHLRDRLLSVDQLRTLPPVKPLITGLLYRDTLAQLAGPPGCYKSFAVTAMSCALASGEPFGSHVVPRAGTVVYVAAEGSNNLAARILAWCEVAGVDPERLEGRLHILPLPVQLGDIVDVTQAVEVVQELGADLLVLDTRARCTLGLDENSATEQGRAIAAADRIRDAAGCTVLGVHHSARAGSAGRGSNAWDGAVWSDLRMEGKALQATIKCEKHKDVPSGCEHHLGLVWHTVSADLMPGTLEPERQTLVLSGITSGIESFSANSQRVVLEIIRNSAPPEGFTGPQVIELAEALDVKKSATYEALKVLVEEGHVDQVGSTRRSRYVAAGGAR
jgi:hypothetical protein